MITTDSVTNDPAQIASDQQCDDPAPGNWNDACVHIANELRVARTASDFADDKAEIERLRGLLIDPGSPAWEDARAVLVSELRKAGLDKHADGVASADGSYVPSHIALNLIAQAARRPAPGDGSGRLQAVWDAQPDLPPIEFTPAEEAAIYAAFQAAPTSDVARASRHSTLEARVSHVGADGGYAIAFYEIAKMLGIGAQAASPADVWRDQMRPKLEALTQVTESTAYRTSLIGRETARADQAEAALAAITAGFDPSDANRPSDEQLEAYLPASVRAEKRCGIQRSAWLTSWFVPWSPRNDNENAEGPWSHWVALAHEILKADAKAIAAAASPAKKTSRFDPPGLWESEPRSSADDAGEVIR
jgi:hypothetical protein